MFEDIIARASNTYRVPESWIRAIIQTESSWDARAYRAEPQINDASYGLGQLLLKTARGLGYQGPATGLYDPEVNIMLFSKLLADLRARYGEDFRRIYSAYNSGKPDLWQTSTQVGKNVARAILNLEKYIVDEVGDLTATVQGSPATQTAIASLIILALLWAWAGKKR